MSVAGEVKSLAVSVMPRWRRFANNATKWLRLLVRHPRATARPAWRAPARIAAWGVPALAAIAATMVIADRAAIVANSPGTAMAVNTNPSRTDNATRTSRLMRGSAGGTNAAMSTSTTAIGTRNQSEVP